MAYFLRYTNRPNADLERGYSYHVSDFQVGEITWGEEGETEEETVAKSLNCDVDD